MASPLKAVKLRDRADSVAPPRKRGGGSGRTSSPRARGTGPTPIPTVVPRTWRSERKGRDAFSALVGSLAAGGPQTRAINGRDTIYRRSLAVADVVAAAATLFIARAVAAVPDPDLGVIAAVPLIVLVAKVMGIYDRQSSVVRKSTLDEAPALFQLAMVYAVFVWLADAYITGVNSAHQLLVELVALFALLLIFRSLARGICRRVTPPERCLVIGIGSAADRIREKLEERLALHACAVAFVSLDEYEGAYDRTDIMARTRFLRSVVAEHRVERIVVAPEREEADEVLDLVRAASSLGVKVTVAPRLLGVVGSSVEFDEVQGMPLLSMRCASLNRSSLTIKRLLDVVVAAVALTVLSPLLLLIAIAIELESRGGVLFRQARIGRDGTEFEMLKFRTMYDGAHEQREDLRHLNEADGLFKIADDPRVTRVGTVLRRCSLDELPQLWNVIRGDMSLVGPRPLLAEEDSRILGWHRRRLQIAPGMTGHWQILGSSRVPLHEMVDIDYLYVTNWSLWSDLKILLRTVPYVVSRRGM